MKKKIRKWYIVVLVILGIGGYWLSQNMWIFENPILIQEYNKYLNNTEWISADQEAKWKFDNGEITMTSLINDKYEVGTYEIKESVLKTETITKNNIYEFDVYGHWEIWYLTNKTMLLKNVIYFDKDLKLNKI